MRGAPCQQGVQNARMAIAPAGGQTAGAESRQRHAHSSRDPAFRVTPAGRLPRFARDRGGTHNKCLSLVGASTTEAPASRGRDKAVHCWACRRHQSEAVTCQSETPASRGTCQTRLYVVSLAWSTPDRRPRRRAVFPARSGAQRASIRWGDDDDETAHDLYHHLQKDGHFAGLQSTSSA